jgi:PAS domain S-box
MEDSERVLNRKYIEQQNNIIMQQKKELQQQQELIREQKKMLKTQEKELKAIIDNIYEEIYIVDNNGDYILFNEAAKKRTCYSKINMYEYYDLSGNKLDKNDLPITKLMNGESFKNNRIIEYNQNKRYLSINAKPIFDDKGNFIMGIMFFRDITSHILYKESIEMQLEMLNKLIDNLDLPVIRLYYPDLTIKDINQKRYNILKSAKPEIESLNDIIGKKYLDIITDTEGNDIFNSIHEQIKEKKTAYIKHKKWMFLGQEMFVTTLFQPIVGKSGDVEELIGVSFDITSEVKANNQMQKTLKMQEEFVANISHELKTPLNVIYSTIQLFNIYFKNGSLEEKKDTVLKYISTITQNCHRLSKLINNIVDISKIEAGFYELNLSNNNIVEIVEDIVMSVTDYTTSKGLHIIFDTDEEEKIIACDPEKIERIILNLLSNAIKFTEKGGKICVNIRDRDKFVEISVCDNGIGIDNNYLNLIFDRFKQVDKSLSRNAEGTGIGLSLVKSIVELHGGTIYVESKFGKGSKFTVMLPVRKVTQENMLYSSKMGNKNESIKVEFSDISS